MTLVTLVKGKSFLDAEEVVILSKEVADEVVIASQGRRGETLELSCSLVGHVGKP